MEQKAIRTFKTIIFFLIHTSSISYFSLTLLIHYHSGISWLRGQVSIVWCELQGKEGKFLGWRSQWFKMCMKGLPQATIQSATILLGQLRIQSQPAYEHIIAFPVIIHLHSKLSYCTRIWQVVWARTCSEQIIAWPICDGWSSLLLFIELPLQLWH